MEDGSIRIEEATEEALGTYTCVPYNTLGTMGQSAPARLVLKVRPRMARASEWAGARNACPHSLAALSLGPPVLYGATRLGVQTGGWPGAAHPLCRCGGPVPSHHVEKGTSASGALEKLGGGEGLCFEGQCQGALVTSRGYLKGAWTGVG